MFIGNFKDEDFMQESFSPFITQRQTTNILNTLVSDETARSLICEQFVQNFATKGKKTLNTEFHLQWAMECLGYSFSLPPKRFFTTILTSLSIYSDWLLFPEYTPNFMQSAHGFYVKEMLGHMSLAFYPQKDITKQAEVCNEILNTIDKFTSEKSETEEVWMCLLKLAIEIGKSVLANGKLAEILGSRVLKFVFHMFLKTNSRNLTVWKDFETFLWSFCENTWVSVYWAACVNGLTKKVIKFLMSKNKTFLVISFSSPKNSQEDLVLDKDPEHVIYLWTRFLNMFMWQDREILSNRQYFVSGICLVLDLFLKKCEKLNSPKQLTPPTYLIISNSSALNTLFAQTYKIFIKYLSFECRLPSFSINSLLGPFGEWLFSLVSDSKFAVTEKSEAVKVLCRVFEKAQGPLRPDYVEMFLAGVIQCISIRDAMVLSAICEGFLKLTASSILFLNFTLKTDIVVQVVNFFLLDRQSPVNTRRASLNLLSTFTALASFYNISGLGQQISDILIVGIEVETDEKCFETLVWTTVGYLACFRGDPDVLNGYLRTVTEKLESLDPISPNYFVLVDALSLLPYVISKKLVKIETAKYCIRRLLNILPKRGKNFEEQTFRVFQCVLDFILSFPETFYDLELRDEVLKSVQHRKIEDKVKGFQKYISDSLFNRVGKLTDKCRDLTKGWDAVGFYTENVSGVFIERENETQFCIKNTTGEYLWKLVEIGYEPIPATTCVELMTVENKKQRILESSEKVDLENVFEDEVQAKVVGKFCAQGRIDSEFEENAKNPEFSSRRFMKMTENYTSDRKFLNNYRRLVTQLGFLDLDSTAFIFKVERESEMEHYAQLPATLAYLVQLIYLPTPETIDSEYMKSSQHYSSQFKKFLNSLGTPLTDKDFFPNACKKSIQQYTKCIYRDSSLFETVFISPALFSDSFTTGLLDFIEGSHCVVLWNQRLNDPDSKKLPLIIETLETQQKFIILITPISKKLVRINLFGGNPGLLMDNMAVSLKMLAKFLMFTVHCANNKFSQRFSIWKNRWAYLNEVVHKSSQERLSIKDLMWTFERQPIN